MYSGKRAELLLSDSGWPVDRPEILLLSLAFRSFLDESNSSLIDNLYRSAQLKRAKTASGTINYLEANNPRAILVKQAQ